MVPHKPAKFPWINLLAAVTFDASRPRTPEALEALPRDVLGRYWEWAVAQELWRRAAVRGEESPERLRYWQAGEHELDFVLGRHRFLEVKLDRTSALEFSWFKRLFPGAELLVIGADDFRTGPLRGMTLGSFLLGEDEP